MKALVFSVMAGILLASCAPLPVPPIPTPFPSLTPPPPVSTPTDLPVELAPTPTPSDVIFRDDFSTILASNWSWSGVDPHDVSLTAQRGYAQFTLRPGYAFETGLGTLLLRPAPQGDFEIGTRLVFRPIHDYQFAGLIVYESRDAYLQAGREMCRDAGTCVGDGLYMDRYVTGRLQSGGVHLEFKGPSVIYLRLRRQGQTYTLFTSADGAVWSPIGQRQTDMTPAYVGLFAGQNPVGGPTAYFDYFEIRSVPPSD
ncbi:MAG: DUF1349 domain-containing protein [Bacteroidota bacterium]